MKPSVPETGTVIRIEGGKAVVMLKSGHSCRGCGAAAIGLCRANATSMMLTADNPVGARMGDTVVVGLARRIQWRGFLLAYILPLVALILGAVVGDLIGTRFHLSFADVLAGFTALAATAAYTFRKLRRLDTDHCMEVKRVTGNAVFMPETPTDEVRRFDRLSF